MKKILNIFGVAAMTLALGSCTLDAVNYTEKDTSNFPKNDDDANMAIAAVYENLNKVSATPQQSFLYVSMLASDDNFGGGGPNDLLMQAEDFLMVSQADMTNQFFNDRYEGINRANTVIEATAALENETQKQVHGEALFLRAYYYYELASMYGNVPLALATTAAEPVQPTAAELWGQILKDLKTACDIMPSRRLTNGHVDKYTAEALLGRAWLFYTGMYGNGEDLSALTSTNYSPLASVELPAAEGEDAVTLTKQDVIGYIDDCVNNSGYTLVPDFRTLWAYTNKHTVEHFPLTAGQGLKWVEDDNAVNPESMFAIKFNKLADWGTTIGYANGFALHFSCRGGIGDTFPFGTGWGAAPVTENLWNDWKTAEPGDMRRTASIQDVTKLPNYVMGGGGEFIQETQYYEMKISAVQGMKDDGSYSICFENLMYGEDGWTQGANNLQLNNIHDLVLIRFADVLLMQSELKEDVTGINKVRARAGLAPLGSYSLQALQNERRWELAFEGTRWNDIRRWHIAAAALEKQTGTKVWTNGVEDVNKAHGGGYAARYNATAGFQKMPESQVEMSDGGIAQNPGWDGSESVYTAW